VNRSLRHHEIRIFDLDTLVGDGSPSDPFDGVQDRRARVQVEGVTEFIGLGGAAGLDAGGEITGVVPSDAALTDRPQQVA